MIRGDLQEKSDKELLNDWRYLTMHLKKEAISPETKLEYALLARDYFQEMLRRGMSPSVLKVLEPMTFIRDAVIQVGSSVSDSSIKNINDIDILIRSPNKLPGLEKIITKLLSTDKLYDGLPIHFLYEPLGPDRNYKILGDLVLYPFPEETRHINYPNIEIFSPFVFTDKKKLYCKMLTPGLQVKLARLYGAEVEENRTPKNAEPLYWIAFKPRDEKIQALEVSPLRPIQPLKSQTGYGEYTFYDPKSFWEHWGEPNLPFYIEPKINGVRLMAHKRGGKIAIFTEDRKRDRADYLPELVEDLRSLNCDSVILDGEAVLPGKDRADMIAITSSNTPVEGIVYYVFDLIYKDGEDLTDHPLEDRQKILRTVVQQESNLKSIRLLPSYRITNKSDFDKYSKKCIEYPESEGFMAKKADSTYDVDGRSTGWAKMKLFKEIKVKVIGIFKKAIKPATSHSPVKGEAAIKLYKELAEDSTTYMLRCAIYDPESKLVPIETQKKLTESDLTPEWTGKDWKGLECPELWKMDSAFGHRDVGEYAYGSTYAKKLPVEPELGDIATVRLHRITRFVKDDGSVGYSWENPILEELDPERTEPDKVTVALEALDYSEPKPKEEISSKIYYITTDKPTRGVMQIHSRGIYDTKSREILIERLSKADDLEAIWKKENLFWIKSLNALLKDARATEKSGGDVVAAINRHISTRPITDLSNVWNKGNAHIDFRFKHPEKDYLIGWTIDQPKIVLQNVGTGDLIYPLGIGIVNNVGSMTITEKKPPQPEEWLTIVTPQHPTFEAPPGGVGATAKTGAIFAWLAFVDVAAGVCKSYFFEYFIKSNKTAMPELTKLIKNWRRIDFKKPERQRNWFCGFPKNNVPYIATHKKEGENVLWNENLLEIINYKE